MCNKEKLDPPFLRRLEFLLFNRDEALGKFLDKGFKGSVAKISDNLNLRYNG